MQIQSWSKKFTQDENAKEKIEPNCTSESVEKDILGTDNDKEIDNGKLI